MYLSPNSWQYVLTNVFPVITVIAFISLTIPSFIQIQTCGVVHFSGWGGGILYCLTSLDFDVLWELDRVCRCISDETSHIELYIILACNFNI